MDENQILIWADEIKKYAGGEGYGGFLATDAKTGEKHLPTKKDGKISRALASAAWAALFSAGGHRGKKYEGTGKAEAKKKLRALYKRMGWDAPEGKSAESYLDDTITEPEMSDQELATIWGVPNYKSITDAPKLRAKDAQYCAGCNYFKYLPPKGNGYDLNDGDAIAMPAEGVCSMHEFATSAGWVCDDFQEWNWENHKPGGDLAEEAGEEGKSAPRKIAPIKMVGETHFAGYGLRFAQDKREKDLTGTKFEKETNYGQFYDHAPIFYHHGLNASVDLEQIASTVKAQIDDIGIWVEGELNKSAKYWKGVVDLIKQGKLFYSSGTAEHLIRYGDNGSIKNWPVIEWTLTPTPAEPRLNSVAFYKSIGIDLDGGAESLVDDKGKGDDKSRQSQKRDGEKRDARNESSIKSEVINMELTPEQLAEQVQSAVKAAMEAQNQIALKAAQEVEAKKQAEETRQAEIKTATEKAVTDAVAAYKASLPVEPTQRPGYGQYNVLQRPLGDGFSFSKAIRGIAFQTDGKPSPWSGAERERDTMMKYANEVRSSLAEGVGNLGGYLVPPEYMQDQFIPLLRARAVVRQAGARTYPAKSDIVYIPSQTGGATAAWYGENATLSASNLTFGQLAINIRKLGALEYISNELLADSSPAADQLVREDLANVIALKEDSTYLMSNGVAPNFANAPIGFASYAGTSTVTLTNDGAGNGAALIIADLFKFKLALMQANVPFDNSMAWFCSPRTWDEIAQFKDSQNRYLLETLTGGNVSQYPAYGAYPEGPETSIKGSVQGRLFGYPVFVTANITDTNTWGNISTASYLFFARMNDVFIAERAGLELMASNVAGTAFASDQTWVRGIMREGLGIRHAPAVAVAGGLT